MKLFDDEKHLKKKNKKVCWNLSNVPTDYVGTVIDRNKSKCSFYLKMWYNWIINVTCSSLIFCLIAPDDWIVRSERLQKMIKFYRYWWRKEKHLNEMWHDRQKKERP